MADTQQEAEEAEDSAETSEGEAMSEKPDWRFSMTLPLADQIRQKVESLRKAITYAYTGSAEHGSFLRNGGSEYVPSVFMTLDELDDLLAISNGESETCICTQAEINQFGTPDPLCKAHQHPPVLPPSVERLIGEYVGSESQWNRSLDYCFAKAAATKLATQAFALGQAEAREECATVVGSFWPYDPNKGLNVNAVLAAIRSVPPIPTHFKPRQGWKGEGIPVAPGRRVVHQRHNERGYFVQVVDDYAGVRIGFTPSQVHELINALGQAEASAPEKEIEAAYQRGLSAAETDKLIKIAQYDQRERDAQIAESYHKGYGGIDGIVLQEGGHRIATAIRQAAPPQEP